MIVQVISKAAEIQELLRSAQQNCSGRNRLSSGGNQYSLTKHNLVASQSDGVSKLILILQEK